MFPAQGVGEWVRVRHKGGRKGGESGSKDKAGRTAAQDKHALIEELPVDGLYVPCARCG